MDFEPVPTLNVDLLLKVKAAILAEPRRFDMGDFLDDSEYMKSKGNICDTTMCIGGWAAVLSGVEIVTEAYGLYFNLPGTPKFQFDIHQHAKTALGLTDVQAATLFYSNCELRGDYGAYVAAIVIDILIETGRVDWRAARERAHHVDS